MESERSTRCKVNIGVNMLCVCVCVCSSMIACLHFYVQIVSTSAGNGQCSWR